MSASKLDSQIYKTDSIVWVKLQYLWWPAKVIANEHIPEDFKTFKRLPLVCVKFFNEEKYEYVYKAEHIHPYQCDRKTEFICKGLKKLNQTANKFSADVRIAELGTNGDVDIIETAKHFVFGARRTQRKVVEPKLENREILKPNRKKDNVEIRVMIQNPKTVEECVCYKCCVCSYATYNLDDAITHNKSHQFSMVKVNTNTIDEDIERVMKPLPPYQTECN